MKKLLAFLLALMMLFSVATLIAGCEDSGKKTSSSKNDDEDADEDEDEDKDSEDKDDEDKDDENKDDEDKDDEDKDDDKDSGKDNDKGDDKDNGKDDDNGSDSEEMMSYLELTFSEKEYDSFFIVGEMEGQYVEYAYQRISDTEKLVYICLDDETVLIYRDNDGELTRYIMDGEAFIEDTEMYAMSKQSEYSNIQSYGKFFLHPSDLIIGAEYKKIGTENHEGAGELVVYEAYINGEVVRTLKLQSNTGVVVEVWNADGDMIGQTLSANTGIDLTEFLG